MASKHRDIGLKFRHRSTPNTRRVTKKVGFLGWEGGGNIYKYIYSGICTSIPVYKHMLLRFLPYISDFCIRLPKLIFVDMLKLPCA